jgi:hypothetical protein
MLISCKQGNEDKPLNSNKKTENLKKINIQTEKVEFTKHQAYGIIINKVMKIYDENLKEIGEIHSRFLEKVKITGYTKKMYNQENISDNCEKAKFVKIKLYNKELILFGNDVCEINNEQLFNFQNTKGHEYSIFPVTNFAMGASDNDGLTGCDDYSILIIENKKEKTFSSIGYPLNTKNRNNKTLKEVVLFHDDGAEEKIYNVSTINDTIIIGIKAIYQEGSCIFNLKTTFSNNYSKSVITDKVQFKENEAEKFEDVK